MRKLLGFALTVCIVSSGCASALIRGGLGYDLGTLGVSGVASGVGVQLEGIGYAGGSGSGLGLGASVEVGGFTSDGDGDPMWFTTAEVRRRRPFEPSGNPRTYWEVGTGVGGVWAPALQHVAIPLQAEVGLERDLGGAMLTLGVRERFLIIVGSGSPPLDALNSLQLVLGLGLVAP